MAVALVASVAGVHPTFGGTTPAINTTGATLLVAAQSWYTGEPPISDSKGNTWVKLTSKYNGIEGNVRLYYVANPVVGSGHTFTNSGVTQFQSAYFMAFSGIKTTSSYDVENGATGSGTSLATGSITPSVPGSLVVTAFCVSSAGSGSVSIDSGFTIDYSYPYSADESLTMAHLIHSSGAINPTWTKVGGNKAVVIAAFKAVVAAGDRPFSRPFASAFRGAF